MAKTRNEHLLEAIQLWMIDLNDYPGWKDWSTIRVGRTLHFDDPFLPPVKASESEFKFSEEIEKQHAVVFQYFGLYETIESLKQCEYYFRRYPFRDFPVSRANHIQNVCEMYFGRFYEFRERLKNYMNAMKRLAPEINFNIGQVVKQYDKLYDQELRERHNIHHRCRYQDLAVDRVNLTGLFAMNPNDEGWKKEHLSHYRKITKEWAERVRKSGTRMDKILDVVADITLTNCQFLSSRLAQKSS